MKIAFLLAYFRSPS